MPKLHSAMLFKYIIRHTFGFYSVFQSLDFTKWWAFVLCFSVQKIFSNYDCIENVLDSGCCCPAGRDLNVVASTAVTSVVVYKCRNDNSQPKHTHTSLPASNVNIPSHSLTFNKETYSTLTLTVHLPSREISCLWANRVMIHELWVVLCYKYGCPQVKRPLNWHLMSNYIKAF